MSEVHDLIKREADRIRLEIKDGLIYGEPIDNEDARLVAAYYCGAQKNVNTLLSVFEVKQ